MPFKKNTNNSKKNKTKKQQKKTASKVNDDSSSVEEIITQDNPNVIEADITEIEPESILSEEELQALEDKRLKEEEAERAHQEYMRVNYYIPAYQEWRKKWEDDMIADLEDPEYWQYRINLYEGFREKYNKKAAWTAQDVAETDKIDEEIKTMEKTIDRLYGLEEEVPRYNPILGGADWWKTDDYSDWVSTK